MGLANAELSEEVQLSWRVLASTEMKVRKMQMELQAVAVVCSTFIVLFCCLLHHSTTAMLQWLLETALTE